MKLKNAPIQKTKRKSIFLTFLLLLTLPIFIFSLLENKSFDIRNRAFEDVQVSEINPCVITFPNVNPYTLEVDKTVRVQVDALSQEYGIKSIKISDEAGNDLLTKSYDGETQLRVVESFPYTPQVASAYNLTGTLVDNNEKTYGCVISSSYDIKGVKAIITNSKPEFKTSPRSSIPSQSLKIGETYEYTLEAEDIDKDMINYSYSFTTGHTWLKATVIEDGGGGKLTIKFRGSTNTPGSYLANVFIHDGYSKHLSSQSWVISVSPKSNDNPVVTIIEPEKALSIKDQTSVRVSWEAVDSNKIVKYEVYLSSNPVNELTWKAINTNILPPQNSHNVDLTNIPDGAYRIIVRAIDNQNPAGIGLAISEEIIISRGSDDDDPDDNPVLPQPQIINVSPTSSDSINNTTPTIKASLIATLNSTIDETSIVVKLDNKDISKEIKINKISASEYTIIYIPTTPLSTGIHKVYVSFKDSSKENVEKEWTFTISTGEQDTEMLKIFGLEIPKRTVYIIGGGLTLIALAIVIPMIIMAIWKDRSKDISINTSLPPSIPPSENIPTVTTTRVQEIVKETPQVLEPQLQPEIPEPIFEAPEPEEDLTNLYEQIKDLEEQDKKETTT